MFVNIGNCFVLLNGKIKDCGEISDTPLFVSAGGGAGPCERLIDSNCEACCSGVRNKLSLGKQCVVSGFQNEASHQHLNLHRSDICRYVNTLF